MSQTTGAIPPKTPIVFPFWPSETSIEERTRMELMQQLNMWSNNNPAIAKVTAITLINLIAEQFNIDIAKEVAGYWIEGEEIRGLEIGTKPLDL